MCGSDRWSSPRAAPSAATTHNSYESAENEGKVIMSVGIFLIIIILAFLGLLIGVGGTILWIWAIIHCIQNRRLSDGEKALWVLLIIFTHFIGAVIYFAVGRSASHAVPYPYAGQQQQYQYPYATPGQQQPYQQPNQYPSTQSQQQQPDQYYQPPMPMYQTQYYSETPQASYPEQHPPQE